MRLRPLSVVAVVARVSLVVILLGCGSGDEPVAPLAPGGVQPMAMVSLPLSNAFAPAADYRWGDIAGNQYSSSFASSFSYNTPTVTVTFDDMGGRTLSGTLTATGLKPNFAYQIKLEGKPTVDAWANERIGYLGRWWSPTMGNVDDTYYELHKNTEAILGYLLFDFFITRGDGSATRAFKVDSSYHVVWNAAQPGAPLASAGPTQQWAPVWSEAAYGTVRRFVTKTQTLFAEKQAGRPEPGDALLPVGNYNCALVITEESFHDFYAGGGNWAAAMRHDSLSFAVTAVEVRDLAVTSLSTASNIVANKSTTVGVVVANKGPLPEASALVTLTDTTTGQTLGTASTGALAAGSSTALSFAWTPTVKGSHTLKAEVAPVDGEEDLANNALIKTVRVK